MDDRCRELMDKQLDPELRDLMLDDKQQLVVMLRIGQGMLL